MTDEELREITEQIWGGVEYGNSAGAREQLRALLVAAWDEGHRFTGYDPAAGENPYRA